MAPPVNASFASQPPNPKRIPNISFGDVLDFPSSGLQGWTVTGIDPKTGRVTVAKRMGDAVENRSIPLEEYEAAQKEAQKSKKQKAKKPAFRLGQSISSGGDSLRVAAYDGKSGTALVEGLVDGKSVRRWIDRSALNTAATSLDPEAMRPAFEAAARDQAGPRDIREVRKELRERREAKKKTGGKVATSASLSNAIGEEKEIIDREIRSLDPRTAESPSLAEKKRETLETYKELLETDQAIADAELEDPDAFRETTKRRNELKAAYEQKLAETVEVAREAGVPEGQTASMEKELKVNRPLVEIGGRVADLQTKKMELAKPGKTAASSTEVRRELKKLDRELRKIMREGAAAASVRISGSVDAGIQAKITGRVRGKQPAAGAEIDLSIPTARAQAVRSVDIGAIAGATASAVAAAGAQALDRTRIVSQAQAALGELQARVASKEQALDQLRSRMNEVSQAYASAETQRMQATQNGNEQITIELTGRMQTLDDERRSLQSKKLDLQADAIDLRWKTQTLESNLDIVQRAGPSASPVALDQLEAAIPSEVVAIRAPQVAKPSEPLRSERSDGVVEASSKISRSTAAGGRVSSDATRDTGVPLRRSYAPGVPAVQRPPTRIPGAAARIREGLSRRTALPQQAFTGAAIELARGQDRIRRDSDVGGDAYEQALAREGGLAAPTLPSYAAQAPSTADIEEEDLFESDLAKQRAIREQEAQQRAAKEMLQPSEAPSEEGAEASAVEEGSAPQGTRPPRARPEEIARARGLQARQTRARGLKAGLEGEFAGRFGQDTGTAAGIRRIKRGYDVLKAGSALSFWGILLTLAVMNIQMLNKIFKVPNIPQQSLVEDLLTLVIDILLLQFMVISTAAMVAIPALIIGLIGGAGYGIWELFSFSNSSTIAAHLGAYLNMVLMV